MKRKLKPYSVLLLYPEYLCDGAETRYDFVRAESPVAALDKARMRAARAERKRDGADVDDIRETAMDFAPILVIKGHHKGLDIEEAYT